MKPRVILIVGQSGTGKTTFARNLVAPSRCKRLLALDPIPDNDGGWATTCEVAEDWEHIYEAVQRQRFRVVTQEELYSRDQAQEQLEHAIRIARSAEVARGGGCTFLLDELSPYFKKGHEAPDSIQGLVRFGRRQFVETILISQRAYDCPVEVRSQLTDLIAFRLNERDIEHIRDFIGRDNAEKIQNLPFYHYVHFDLTGQNEKPDEERGNELEGRRVDRGGDAGGDVDRPPGPVHQRQSAEAAGVTAGEDEE